jgi:hypothetical protein
MTVICAIRSHIVDAIGGAKSASGATNAAAPAMVQNDGCRVESRVAVASPAIRKRSEKRGGLSVAHREASPIDVAWLFGPSCRRMRRIRDPNGLG